MDKENKEVFANNIDSSTEENNIQNSDTPKPSMNQTEEPKSTTTENSEAIEKDSIPVTTNIFGLEEEEKEENPVIVEEPKVEKKEEIVEEKQEEENATINGEEKVVFEYKKQKEIGPLPIVLFFLFIGGIIVFLPSIQKYFQDYKNGKITISGSPIEQEEVKPTEEEQIEEETYYNFDSETTISINRLTLSNFQKKAEGINYFITLNVENKDRLTYTYSEKIYIELYNANKTLLARTLLESDKSIAASSIEEISLIVNEKVFSEVTQMVIKQIDPNTYQAITIDENLKEQQELICTLDNRTTIYTFKDYKLLSIDDQIIKKRTDYLDNLSYQEDNLNYKQMANTNNLITGLSASVLDDINEFSYAIKIDLSNITDIDLGSLETRNYYTKNTEARIVAFEMVSRGYNCK